MNGKKLNFGTKTSKLQYVKPSSFFLIIQYANFDSDTVTSPPLNTTVGNVGGNNPNNDRPTNPNTGKNTPFDRQPSGSIRSTNSSISVVSGSNKTNSEVSMNPGLKNPEELTNGMDNRKLLLNSYIALFCKHE